MNTNVLDSSNDGKLNVASISGLSMGNITSLEQALSAQLSPILTNSYNERKVIQDKRNKSRINLESRFERKTDIHKVPKENMSTVMKKSPTRHKLKKAIEVDKDSQKKERYDSLNISDTGKTAKPTDTKHMRGNELKKITGKGNHSKVIDKSVLCSKNDNNNTKFNKGKEFICPKETLININIKGYENQRSRHGNKDELKNNMKGIQNNNEDIIKSQKDCNIPEKLVDASLFSHNDLSDSILSEAFGDISRNLFIVEHKSQTNNVVPICDEKENNDLLLSTQETNLFFANFTPNLSSKTTTKIENAVDNDETNITLDKYAPLASESSLCSTVQEKTVDNLSRASNQYLIGCTNEDKLEIKESSNCIKKILIKLEGDIHAMRNYKYTRRRKWKENGKELNSSVKDVTKLEKPLYCKKSKSMDVISTTSADHSQNLVERHSPFSACLSPTKNIQIEIKNSNVINIQINSALNECPKRDSGEKENKECKRTEEPLLEDKFLLHQHKLERTVKETCENVRYDVATNDIVKCNRKKPRDETDMALAPASKRNRFENKTSPKSNAKRTSPRKCKPIINVFNVTAPTSIITSEGSAPQTNPLLPPPVDQLKPKPSRFVTSFSNLRGNGLTVSEKQLKAVESKFDDGCDSAARRQNLSTTTSNKDFPKTELDAGASENLTNIDKKPTPSNTSLERNINSKILEYPKLVTSNNVVSEIVIDDVINELYQKDIREILQLDASTSSLSSLNAPQKNSNESLGSKKEHEMIEDAIRNVNNAIEIIEKKEITADYQQKKSLGMRRCKVVNTACKEMDTIRQKLEAGNNVPLLQTPKNMKSLSRFGASTPIRSNLNNHFAGDYITPIKNLKCSIGDSFDDDEYNRVSFKQNSVASTEDDYFKEIDRLKCRLAIMEERKQMCEIQRDLIERGSQEHRRERDGRLSSLKSNRKKTIPLKDLERMMSKESVPTSLTKITAANAQYMQFNLDDDKSSEAVVRTIDGAIVIPDVHNKVGLQEIERAFTAMPGVKPDLIPCNWILNHYKWIVWKLASYDRKFTSFASVLTIENVIQQLKFRYDKELYKNKHPALRRIFEGNDISEKRMVLCVADVIRVSDFEYELELCDGWYSVRTKIDKPLTNKILKGQIVVGTKLAVQYAKLLNAVPCYPLNATEEVRLEINYNNTRRAVWHAKLGYQKVSHFQPISLSMVHPYGGVVSCLKIYIARVYPVKFLEITNERKVWRNENAENMASENHYVDLETEADRFLINRKDMETLDLDMNEKIASVKDISEVDCPELLNALMERSHDPENIMSKLNTQQMETLRRYKDRLQENYQSKLIEEMVKLKEAKKRDVVPVLKLLVYDVDGTHDLNTKGTTLLLWGPKKWHFHILKEEKSVLAYNLIPQINCDLKSTSKTYFDSIISKPVISLRRRLLSIEELHENQLQIGTEFDTFGIFVKRYKDHKYQQIWLTDLIGRLLCVHVYYAQEECLFLNLITGKAAIFANLRYGMPNEEFSQASADHFSTVSMNNGVSYQKETVDNFLSNMPKNVTGLISESLPKIESLRQTLSEDARENYKNGSSYFKYNRSNISLESSDYRTLLPSQITDEDIAMCQITI